VFGPGCYSEGIGGSGVEIAYACDTELEARLKEGNHGRIEDMEKKRRVIAVYGILYIIKEILTPWVSEQTYHTTSTPI
jgi:hypothetical protein